MTPADYRRERLARGLTQAALAKIAGVSRGCINYREAGHPRYPITAEAWLALTGLPPKSGKPPARPPDQGPRLRQ